MTRVIIVGCNGAMGQVLTKVISKYEDVGIVAGFDIANDCKYDYDVYSSFDDIERATVAADVIVDFSHPSALEGVIKFAEKDGIPVVLATTGYSEQHLSIIKAASEKIPVFRSANMSLGINLLIDLIEKATSVLGRGFDIEIVEKHHRLKADAPSGTALMLADAVNAISSGSYEYIYDRHSRREKRGNKEIGIHAVRGGTIVGEHAVIFAGNDEVIEIKHSAASKEVFAEGAVKAVRFMAGKPPGLYNMADLIKGTNKGY